MRGFVAFAIVFLVLPGCMTSNASGPFILRITRDYELSPEEQAEFNAIVGDHDSEAVMTLSDPPKYSIELKNLTESECQRISSDLSGKSYVTSMTDCIDSRLPSNTGATSQTSGAPQV